MTTDATTKTPSNGPATSKDISYILRDIDDLKTKKADMNYVEAKDLAMGEVISAKLGDVEAMKRFIIAALVVIAGLTLGGGGVIIWRASCVNTTVIETAKAHEVLAGKFQKHVDVQQIERMEDVVLLNNKLSFMEQRLVNTIVNIAQGKTVVAPSPDEYIQLRKEQALKDIERLEASTGMKIPTATKSAITDSVKEDINLLPRATVKEVTP